MTFYMRLSRQQCRQVLRYPVELPAEIFDRARIDNPEFAVAFALPGAVVICEPNQLDKWKTLVTEFAARESATAAPAAPPAESAPPASGEERSE
jgi:hypothetical protein